MLTPPPGSGGPPPFNKSGSIPDGSGRYTGNVYVPWEWRTEVERAPWKGRLGNQWFRNYKTFASQPKVSGKWLTNLPYARVVQRGRVNGLNYQYSGPYGSSSAKTALVFGDDGPGSVGSESSFYYWGAQQSGGLPLVPSGLKNQVTTEMLVKLSRQDYNLGIILAEGRKTSQMIATRTLQVLRAFRSIRRGRWRDAARLLGISYQPGKAGMTPHQLWLEMQYGWKPYLGDIYGAVKSLNKSFREEGQLIRVSRQLVREDATPPPYGGPGSGGSSRLTVKAIAYYEVHSSTAVMLQEAGLINPFQVAWEVVPFSFLLDWFIPVGNMLQASTASWGMRFKDGCYVYTVRAKYSVTINPNKSGGSWVTLSNNRKAVSELFGMQRVPMVSVPLPGFYMTSPFSSTRVANALALVAALSGRR